MCNIQRKSFDCNKGNFKTWVLMLAKYRALAYKRKNVNNLVDCIDDYRIEDSCNVEKQIISREAQERLIETINSFNETDRELFFRRYFFGENICDLMYSLGLSRSAIDNRLSRGRKMIREAISNE